MVTTSLSALFMKKKIKCGNFVSQLTQPVHRLYIQRHIKLLYRLTWCLCLVLLIVPSPASAWTVLIGLGDSLTHGTMDARNTYFNSWHAYLQKVSNSIAQEIPLAMKQPYFDLQEERISPFVIPSNLGIDGSDIFSIEGIEYHKRVGADFPFVSPELLCNEISPDTFADKYDKVLFPINLEAGQEVSALDAGIWLINETLPSFDLQEAFIIFWSGNNDSSLAALGAGGQNPEFQPIPFDVIGSELSPVLSLLLAFAEISGEISFEPYTQSAIERNLTEQNHFFFQYIHILDRLTNETALSSVQTELFLLTLPYYSAVGYLFDSEDLEFYLRKINSGYSVPDTFRRVAPAGEPITDPLQGDRISLLTFGMMYALLSTGHSVDHVNQVLEIDGQQRDGLVLSEEEQQFIMSRIDGFNAAIEAAASYFGPNVHVIQIGQFLNNVLTGQIPITVNDRVFSRKWIRGGGFSFDGVHPSYTGHALIADFVLYHMNNILGLNAPLYDLSEIMMIDPYIDRDGDGWAPGPGIEGGGITRLLYLLKDPDDSNPDVQVEMPPDVWDTISDVLLSEILAIPAVQAEADRLGIMPLE